MESDAVILVVSRKSTYLNLKKLFWKTCSCHFFCKHIFSDTETIMKIRYVLKLSVWKSSKGYAWKL